MSVKQPAVAALAGTTVILLLVAGCSDTQECPSCNGTGWVNVVDTWSGQQGTFRCPDCGGTGEIRKPATSTNDKPIWKRIPQAFRPPLFIGALIALQRVWSWLTSKEQGT